MKNTDLMVGNLVSFYGKFEKVESIGTYGVSFKNGFAKYTLPNLKPIPLTEEILLKCGFEDVSSYKDYWLTIEDDLRIEISLRHNGRIYTSISDVGVSSDIKYVHQLQNLYHALTGQELKIEL